MTLSASSERSGQGNIFGSPPPALATAEAAPGAGSIFQPPSSAAADGLATAQPQSAPGRGRRRRTTAAGALLAAVAALVLIILGSSLSREANRELGRGGERGEPVPERVVDAASTPGPQRAARPSHARRSRRQSPARRDRAGRRASRGKREVVTPPPALADTLPPVRPAPAPAPQPPTQVSPAPPAAVAQPAPPVPTGPAPRPVSPGSLPEFM